MLANRMLTRVRQAARREVRPTSYEAARWSAILLAVPAPAQLLAVLPTIWRGTMHAWTAPYWHHSATVLEGEAGIGAPERLGLELKRQGGKVPRQVGSSCCCFRRLAGVVKTRTHRFSSRQVGPCSLICTKGDNAKSCLACFALRQHQYGSADASASMSATCVACSRASCSRTLPRDAIHRGCASSVVFGVICPLEGRPCSPVPPRQACDRWCSVNENNVLQTRKVAQQSSSSEAQARPA